MRPPAVFFTDHRFRSPLFSSADVRACHPVLEAAEDLRDLKRRTSLRAVFAVAMEVEGFVEHVAQRTADALDAQALLRCHRVFWVAAGV
jgi:hypothetical protein